MIFTVWIDGVFRQAVAPELDPMPDCFTRQRRIGWIGAVFVDPHRATLQPLRGCVRRIGRPDRAAQPLRVGVGAAITSSTSLL